MKFLTIVGVALAILASAGLAQAKGSKPIPTPTAKAAITAQINKHAKNGTTDSMVEITTVIPAPAHVVADRVKAPKNIKVLGIMPSKPCTAPTGNCKQRFKIRLDANKACKLDGDYQLMVKIACLKGACKPGAQTIPFKLKSEFFCAK